MFRPRNGTLGRWLLMSGLVMTLAQTAVSMAQGVRKPEVWAVLVGIDGYQAIPDTPGARRDALTVRNWMQREAGTPPDHILVMDRFSRRDHLGTEVALADLYPNRENLSWVLRTWLPARVQPGDIVVVYFAGQAVGLPPRDDAPPGSPHRNFLLPIDADPTDIPGTGWAIENDLGELAARGRNPIFVWLDTSLTGRGVPVFEGLQSSPASQWLDTIARWPGVSAWLAADDAPEPEDLEAGTSPFVRALVDGLGTKNQRRNLLACLSRMHRDPQLTSHGFRTSGSVPSEATLWVVDLTPRRVLPPELALRNGHSDRVLDLALTSDGARLITAGADSTVKLWRMDDRSLLRTQPDHFIGVTKVTISPDGKRLASGDGAGSVWVYRLPEFVPLQTRATRPHHGPVEALAFLDDGERLASLDTQGNVMLWDVSGRSTEPRSLSVTASALAAGGGWLAIAWSDPALQNASRFTIHDREGNIIGERPGPGGLTTAGLMAVDADRLAIADRGGGFALWSTHGDIDLIRRDDLPGPIRAVQLATTSAVVAAGGTVQIVPTDPGARVLNIAANGSVDILATTSDARYIASATRGGVPRVWDRSRGDEPQPVELPEFDKGARSTSVTAVSRMVFAPGAGTLVVGCESGAVRFWSLPDATPRAEIPAHRGQIQDLAVSSNARHLLQITRDGDASLWDLDLGRTLQPIRGRWTSGVFVDGADLLALTDSGGELALIDRASGQRIDRDFERPMIEGRAIRSSAAFDKITASPDGRFLAAGATTTDLACLWETDSGRLLRVVRSHPEGIARVAFSADSSLWLTAGHEGKAKLWATDGVPGQPPLLDVGDGDAGPPVTAAAIDPTSTGRIVLGDQEGRIARWAHGVDNQPVREELGQLRGTVRALAFTSDGRWLAAAGEDKEIRLFDLADPRPRSFRLAPRHDEEVSALAAWPDSPILASGSFDSTIRLWKLDEQSLLGTLAASPASGTWVAFTTGGHFDSSPGAEQRIARVHDGGRVSSLDQDYARLRAFRLVATLRRGSAPLPPPIFEPGQLPSLVLDAPPARTPIREVPLSVTLGDVDLTDFRLYLNEIPVRVAADFVRPDPSEPTRRVVLAPLRRGRNELYAMASRGEPGAPEGRSNIVTIYYDGPEQPGRLHILALGVDDYPNRPLKYSAADARELAGFLKANFIDHSLGESTVRVLTNAEVNRESIREALSEIRGNARADDTVAVFIAGHTDVRPDLVGREQFCLLLPGFPFPEVDRSILEANGLRVAMRGTLPGSEEITNSERSLGAVLPYSEIEQWLVRMDALQRLVILDACQAEAVLDDPVARRKRENAARKVDDDAHRVRTTYLLASRRDMPALEVDQLGHGLLTYVLLRGMGAEGLVDPSVIAEALNIPTAGADLDEDSLITTAELNVFADRFLPALVNHFAGQQARSGSIEPNDHSRGAIISPDEDPIDPTPFRSTRLQSAEQSTFPLVRLPR